MDFNNFLIMGQEIGLITVLLIIFSYDLISTGKFRILIYPLACILFAIQTVSGFFPLPTGEAFGGMFVNSNMTILMKNIFNIATLIVILQSNSWLHSKDIKHKRGEFFTILLVTLLGMYIMISSGNFLMLYIGMETASIPLACLAAFNKRQVKSAEAGVKYIMLSAFSSSILLFGLSFIYGSTGSLYFSDISLKGAFDILGIFGFIFFFGGLGFKISLVPFHLWTADVYEGAPTSVTAYLSAVSKGAAAFALLFALFKAFGKIEIIWTPVLWWLSVITITLGNLFAIRQTEIKRFFAFSSISQAGYILLGIIAGNSLGMTATVYYVLIYIFSSLAVFGVISEVEKNSGGNTSISAFYGLYKTNPAISLIMLISVFSLGGLPPLAGFFSKYFIFMAAASKGQYLLVFIALLNTVLSLYYYLLIVKAMFIKERENSSVERFSTDNYNKAGLIICTLSILVIGILSCIYNNIDKLSFGI